MIHFFDSFGNASAAAHDPRSLGDDLRTQWLSDAGAITVTELESGANGRRAYVTGAAGRNLKPNCVLPEGGITVGFRFWLDDLATDRTICAIRQANEFLLGTIGFDATDAMLVYSTSTTGNPSASIVSKSTSALSVGWNYIEVRVKAGTTDGEVHWAIGGTPAGSDTEIDTIVSEFTPIRLIPRFMPTNSGGDWNANDRLADIYVQDFDDALLGITEVWYQAADVAGASADFTPSAGANEENVDDIGNDGDSTYNASATPGARDALAHSAVATGAPYAIQALALVRTEGHPQLARLGVISGGTSALGVSEEMSSDGYDGMRGPIEAVDPDTATAWTTAGIDAAQTIVEIGA